MATLNVVYKIAADISGLQRNVEQGVSIMNRLEKAARLISSALVVRELVQWTTATVDYASAVSDMSARTGIGTKALQQLEAAGKQVGIELTMIASTVNMLQKRLAGGDESAVGAVRALGLSLDAMRAMRPEDQFFAIADRVAKIEDPMTRVKVATDLFGKTGSAVLPLLTADLDALRRGAAVMSDGTIQKLDALGDRLDQLRGQFRSVFGTALVESVEGVKTFGESVEFWLGRGFAAIGGLGSGRGAEWAREFGSAWARAAIDAGTAQESAAGKTKRHGQAVDDLNRQYEELEKHVREVEKIQNRISGLDVVNQTTAWAEAIAGMGGLTKVTTEALHEFEAMLKDSLDILRLHGMAASDNAVRYRDWLAAIVAMRMVQGGVEGQPATRGLPLLPGTRLLPEELDLTPRRIQQQWEDLLRTQTDIADSKIPAIAEALDDLEGRHEAATGAMNAQWMRYGQTVQSVIGMSKEHWQAYIDSLSRAGIIQHVGGFLLPSQTAGFAAGGIGDFGAGTLAMLHGREAIVPLDRGGFGGDSYVIHINAQGAFFDTPESRARLGRQTVTALKTQISRNGIRIER